MRNYWVTSDTHFFHANSLGWEHDGVKVRGSRFATVEEMNETMVENWNSVVKPGDYIYHCGDVAMQTQLPALQALWNRLEGSKRLLVGNHDDIKMLAKGNFFKKISYWKYFNEFGCLLTHMPVHQKSFEPAKRFDRLGFTPLNVHGHLHNVPSPEGPYRNVSVEMTDYTPLNLEQIRDEYAQQRKETE
jgi:calcineurin-like phosphoesterase family protein